MTIVQKIKQFLTGQTNQIEASEIHCPNCWGRQEYGGKFMETVRNEKIDLNNLEQKKGWINAYATRYFEGIKLHKAEEGLICAACELTYKPPI